MGDSASFAQKVSWDWLPCLLTVSGCFFISNSMIYLFSPITFRSFMHFLTGVCAIVGGIFTGMELVKYPNLSQLDTVVLQCNKHFKNNNYNNNNNTSNAKDSNSYNIASLLLLSVQLNASL